MPPSEIQRLSQAVEKMADTIRDDLRDVDRALDYIHERQRDISEQLERIETRLRRRDREQGETTNPGVPIVIRDPASGPISLQPVPPTPLPVPVDDSAISADHEKITLRWDFLYKVWLIGRWAILFGAGALTSWLQHYLSTP